MGMVQGRGSFPKSEQISLGNMRGKKIMFGGIYAITNVHICSYGNEPQKYKFENDQQKL